VYGVAAGGRRNCVAGGEGWAAPCPPGCASDTHPERKREILYPREIKRKMLLAKSVIIAE